MPPSQANRVNLRSSQTPPDSVETGKLRRFHALCGAILAYLASVIGSYLGIWDLVPLLRNEALIGPIFLLMGAGLGARRLPLVLAFSSAMVLLLLIVAHTPLAARMASPLRMQASHAEIARGADVVMVLGSWVQSDGALTPASMARLMRGMELVRQKRAPVLVVSEIAPPAGSYVQAARKLASGLNIPLAMQPLTGRIVNTRDEAALFVALARRKGWKRVFLVTSPTHTRRATLMFRRAAQEAQNQKLQVLPIPAMELEADLARLTAPGERINVFKMALREWAGLWIYQRRGWV